MPKSWGSIVRDDEATYPNNVDDNILAIDTAIDIVLARWRASDDKQILVLAEGGVLDQGPVIPDKGCDPVIAPKSLPHDLQASSTVSTQDYIGEKQQRIITKTVSDRETTEVFALMHTRVGI